MQRHAGARLMVTLERTAVDLEPRGGIRSAIDAGRWDAEGLVAEVSAVERLQPFDRRAEGLCEALSGRLMALREHPQAVALGFWMRRASVGRMGTAFRKAIPEDQLAVPRGLAFHVTPANVDTVFVHSWILSLLAGNTNIVRLSSFETDVRSRMLEAIGDVLREPRFEAIAAGNRFILTDHDPGITRSLSAAADVRIIWGGDATVAHFRSQPLPVHGRDISFPDRHSLALLDARAVGELADEALARLADRFYNDAYWFDQGACSSPRLVLWRAARSRVATEEAVRRFQEAVEGVIERRRYQAATGIALEKMAFATEAATRTEGVRIVSRSNEAMWVRLPGVEHYDRENCGGGLFFEVVSHDLASDLSALVGKRDQTATCFGLSAATLRELAAGLNGRGIDRFVPVGEALAFDAVWDGLDLLAELSRRVVVRAGSDA